MGSTTTKVWKCSTSSKTFTTKRCLTYHISTHYPGAKVKCQICGKILKNSKTFSSHMALIHTNRKRPSCNVCHRVCSTPSHLRRHIDTVHTTLKRPRFPCEFPGCGKTYLNLRSVSLHIKTEHSANPVRFPCTLCWKEFKTRPNLEKYISTHTTEKAYICSTCRRSFSQRTAMQRHEVTHLAKSNPRNFKCELCPRTTHGKTDLRRHVQNVHEHRKNHPCTFCDKIFSTASILRRHVEACHPTNTEKIHSCDKCEFMTSSKIRLSNHVRRHNLANRRECYFCKKQFLYFSRLVRHFRRGSENGDLLCMTLLLDKNCT
ncbi:PR domain zinc finger protein 5 isoform X1 [Folsomia candida]|uniref:PR domain zinc finger protein 5 isoform X1 n=1 Tax=Folsomia candida TaxID=158441 RepID=UPI0016053137|nr:PR domain zinc finger protein 5 isoform X1 [Folsomia candida]XP_035712434.1 PR domain zinc finger protein 5 isoform X1 [Folsomia candida]